MRTTERTPAQVGSNEGLGGIPRRMALAGDTNTPALPMTDAEVNHLRRLLAWMRCEWMLDENMQRGYLLGSEACVKHGWSTPEDAGALIAEAAQKINRCPAYVRQAVKMLTKALRDHERKTGILEAQQPASDSGLTSITDLVELEDGTVIHKDDA